MSLAVNLSCDLGEALSPEEAENERALWPLIHAANVACGGHAGDPASMSEAVALCRNHGVILGAHPSYPDRDHFGRRSMKMGEAELRASLLTQMQSLRMAAAKEGLTVQRVKPHGALYNDAWQDEGIAGSILDAVSIFDSGTSVVCQDQSALARLAAEKGVPFVLEGFADRRYESDGRLVQRADPRALLLDFDEAAEQAWLLVDQGMVHTKAGSTVRVRFQTLVIHSDMPGSLERLRAIRRRLAAGGVSFEKHL